MVKLKIVLGADSIEIEADKSLEDLKPLLDAWYGAAAHEPLTQAQIDAWTARVAAASDKLHANVTQNTPS